MRRIVPPFLALFMVSFSLNDSQVPTRNRPGLSLEETFELYVGSVQDSDIEGLFSTVSDDEKFLFITADGQKIDSRRGYYAFHQAWFQEKDWEMPVEVVEMHEGRDYGWVTAVFHYKSKLPEGEPYKTYILDSYFTLVFHREDDQWKVVADFCSPISRRFVATKGDESYTSEQKYLLDVIRTRRTIRKFKPDPVPDEHLQTILDAARFAPTAGNQQPWKFLVIRNRETLDRLRDQALGWYLQSRPASKQVEDDLRGVLKNVLSAPVYIAVLVDSEAAYPDYVHYDGTLAAGNLMIAARALGYGTGFFTTFFPEKQMKEFFKIPKRYRLICFTPIGRPEQWPEPPSKKALEDLVVYEAFK